MSDWGRHCHKCGHPPGYHGMKFCILDVGGASKRPCDCDGYAELLQQEPRPEGEPSVLDLVRELREALCMFAGAMPISPKEAWDESIAEAKRLRQIADNSGAHRD